MIEEGEGPKVFTLVEAAAAYYAWMVSETKICKLNHEMLLGYFRFAEHGETTIAQETDRAHQIVAHMSDLQSFIDDGFFKMNKIQLHGFIEELIFIIKKIYKKKDRRLMLRNLSL